jgi:sialate O-acetylesterase
VALSAPWKYQEVSDGVIGPQLPWGSVHGATLDYNVIISPIGPYTFRAAVWYQGESDVHFGTSYYRAALPALLAEWRAQFRAPDLPFLIVQLPGYGASSAQPAASTWATVREAQREVVFADAHAALAVTIDIGDPADLHPTQKRELGRRLAIAARHAVYGERIPPSGPALVDVRRHGTDAVVAFRDVTGALILRPGTPGGFELCGATQASCRWAAARVDRQSIVLSGAGEATRVRYAWGGSPASSLTDASGLPAGPFEAPIR